MKRFVGAWRRSVWSLALLAGLSAAAPRPPDRVAASSPGPFYGTSGGGEGELVAFDARVAPALLSVPPGERITLDRWPVAPGVARTMVFTRSEVYAEGARIVAIGASGETDVPRSSWVFFLGRDPSGNARAAMAVDPARGTLRGLVLSERGAHELKGPDAWTAGRHRLEPSTGRDADGNPISWVCGEEELPIVAGEPPSSSPGARDQGRSALAAFTKYAVVAIDTDNEFMGTKFTNDTTAATNYIANLFNQMNLIYERDVSVHLLQGYTILRLSTTTDPYTQNSNGNASSPELTEFSNYWSSHYGAVKRTLAAMLSGKQPGAFSASGIAWLNGLCSSGFGYSFSKVFMFAPDTSSNDVFITAHEIGHNFSSPHTHCYADPKPDTCYVQSGTNCFSGTPSCPASATYQGVTTTGTLMSYCHLLGGCAAGLVFHPLTMSRYFNVAIPLASACIFNGASVPPGPTVSGIVPAAGLTAGGTPVTINGSGFVNGATAAFIDLTGSVSLATVVFVNSGQLTAVTPAHAAGTMDVVVFNPDQTTGTLRNGFTYSVAPPPPTVSAIAPNNGTTLGGTAVTITGASFVSGATVSIGGVAATGVAFVNGSTLTATTGAHALGAVNVVVTNPDTQTGTLTAGYYYAPPPSATSFQTLTPCRIVDTRSGATGGPALGPNATRSFAIAGACAVPPGAVAVSANLTILGGGSGYIAVFPGNGVNPGTRNVSFAAGQTRAANAILILATDGTGNVKVANASAGTNDFILDVNGYFQ